MTKPTIKRGPASAHESPVERIVEVFDRESQLGCLINVRRVTDDKGNHTLVIIPYRADKGVKVYAGRKLYAVTP